MTSSEISQEISDLERKLKEALKNQRIVEEQILTIQKEVIILQGKKKDLEITASKGRYNLRDLKIDIDLKKSEFWSVKDSGL